MAIGEATSRAPRDGWRGLAGLFDDAWEHGRRRQVRAFIMLVLAMVGGAAAILATTSGTDGRPVAADNQLTAAPYRVCAANIYGMWRYTYGTAGCTATNRSSGTLYSYYNLVVPAGATVDLTIARSQGSHSLRIAALGLTISAGTNSTARTTFRVPPKNTTYSGKCLTGCLENQRWAATSVITMTRVQYKQWAAAQSSRIAEQTRQLSPIRSALTREGVLANNSSS